MICDACGAPLSSSKCECPACFTHNGFPNVRLAESKEEVEAFTRRLEDARVSVAARKCEEIFVEFGDAVRSSRAVIARSTAILQGIIESETRNYVNYQREVVAGSRNPQENRFDKIRNQFESALFPNFHADITYGCLSLDGRGVAAYGPCFLVLKEKAIAARATVFEENPYVFAERHTLGMTDTIPPGYRATWSARAQLAQAKLHSRLELKTTTSDFPGILISTGSKPEDVDFIEVHIFGSINSHSIEKVMVLKPKTSEDRLILRSVGAKLAKLGIEFKVV